MKYCYNCGSPVDERMSFCPKCGTKLTVKEETPSGYSQLARLKQYNLVLDPSVITWQYIINIGGLETRDLIDKQEELLQEFEAILDDLLINYASDNSELERELYFYILDVCRKLTNSAARMYSNYSGLKEYFEEAKLRYSVLFQSGEILEETRLADEVYKTVASIQGTHAARLKSHLNPQTIYNNKSYREKTYSAATSFYFMSADALCRFKDFFLIPTEDYFFSLWTNYNYLLDGLSWAEICAIGDEAWFEMIDFIEYNTKDTRFRERLIELKKLQEETVKDNERRTFWEGKEKESKKLNLLRELYESQSKELSSLKDSFSLTQNDYLEKEKAVEDIKKQIEANEKEIYKQKNRLFGRNKAEDNISQLENDLIINKNSLEELLTVWSSAYNVKEKKENELNAKKAKVEQLKNLISQIEGLPFLTRQEDVKAISKTLFDEADLQLNEFNKKTLPAKSIVKVKVKSHR